MRKKIAIILNSPYLGGGEKSIIIQSSKLKDDVTYFIPYLNERSECEKLVDFIKINNNFSYLYFKYPKSLFSVSRGLSFFKISFFKILFDIISIFNTIKNIIRHNELVWCNGNKVGVLFYFVNKLTYDKKIIWHFRDYPSTQILFLFLWRTISIFNNSKILFLANSKSVERKINDVFLSNVKTDYLYNPIGTILVNKRTNLQKTIGIVAMMAPWKGIHNIIKWCSKYESKLIKQGIEKINIYGGSIYKTNGEHADYLDFLQKLNSSCENKIIHFMGNEKVENIYNNIDILIHCSIKAEPFGRVLIEAAQFNIPIASTGIGGAEEVCSLLGISKYNHYDEESLFKLISIFVQNNFLLNSKAKLGNWDKQILEKTEHILCKVLKF